MGFSLQQGQLANIMLNTPAQQLTNQYMNVPAAGQNHSDDLYIEALKQQGIKPHPSLYPAYFTLKNGLTYPGMASSSPIGPGETLVSIPQGVMLSSMKALRNKSLKQVYGESFYKVKGLWQDRVLNTYCLYIHNLEDKDNIFYQMIQQFSKDVDLACFWPENQLALFKDKKVLTSLKLDLQQFEEEWKQFETLQAKYEILRGKSFTKDNYRWIFTHITSRCFGKKLPYTSFAPFAELFNHHASTVFYKTNQNQELQEQKSEISSEGSCESDQCIQEGEFDYDNIETVPIAHEKDKLLSNLNHKEEQQIRQQTTKLLNRVEQQIDWKDFSILFVGQFMQKALEIERSYLYGQTDYFLTNQSLSYLQKVLEKYLLLVKAFYQTEKGKNWKYLPLNIQNPQQKQKQLEERIDPLTYNAPFTQLTLQTGHRDRFNAHSEIYFRYGKNSNKDLLRYYGFAIEGNKYDQVWVSYDLDYSLQVMPALLERMKKLRLSIRRKFNINRSRLNLELIMFHRLNSWNLTSIESLNDIFFVMDIERELEILAQVKQTFTQKLDSLEGDYNLQDKSLNYHQYFINVYHIEQIRILQTQINFVDKLCQVLKMIIEGTSREQAELACISQSERRILGRYLDSVV